MPAFDDVVVFAHHYPFWNGPSAETYLEHEVRILSAHVHRIFVVVCELWTNSYPMRDGVPQNVIPVFIGLDWTLIRDGVWKRRLSQLRYSFTPEFVSDRKRIENRVQARDFFHFVQTSEVLFEQTAQKLFEVAPDLGEGKTLLYSFWFNEPARAAVLLADLLESKGLRRPIAIARCHGYDCYDYRSESGYLPCKTWMASRLNAIFACSRDGREHLARNNPRVADRFRVGHLGTKSVKVPTHEAVRQRRLVVTCSRMVPLKRLDRVAQALALLNGRGLDFEWVCIGDGETLDPVRRLAGELGLGQRARFVGALSQDELYDFYAAERDSVAVFVNASEVEGIPISIMEAMSFGIPAVATKVGGNPEIVEDGVCGKLVSVDFSDQELAGAMEFFLVDGREDFRVAARRNWERNFSVEENTLRLLADCEQM